MPKRRLSQEERRTQIIEEAISLFASKGFRGTTTREIASTAGVSEAIIFRHFATKEDLYDAIITYTVQRRLSQWESETLDPPEGQDLGDILRAFATSYIRRNRQDPTFVRLMMYSALEDHKFREKFFEINRSPRLQSIRSAIELGIASGEMRPVDPNLAVRGFFSSLLHYCISQFIASATPVDESADLRMVENLVSIYLHGLYDQVPSREPQIGPSA